MKRQLLVLFVATISQLTCFAQNQKEAWLNPNITRVNTEAPRSSFFAFENADKAAKAAQIKILEESIARREKLLANDNYVKKAPAKIVEMDRVKLEEEKKKLEELKK